MVAGSSLASRCADTACDGGGGAAELRGNRRAGIARAGSATFAASSPGAFLSWAWSWIRG